MTTCEVCFEIKNEFISCDCVSNVCKNCVEKIVSNLKNDYTCPVCRNIISANNFKYFCKHDFNENKMFECGKCIFNVPEEILSEQFIINYVDKFKSIKNISYKFLTQKICNNYFEKTKNIQNILIG